MFMTRNFHDDGTREQHQILYLLGRADAALRVSERIGQLKKNLESISGT